MKIKYVGSIVAVVVALCAWMISNVSSYGSMRNEWLFVVMFLIVFGTVGGIIGELFEPKHKFEDFDDEDMKKQ